MYGINSFHASLPHPAVCSKSTEAISYLFTARASLPRKEPGKKYAILFREKEKEGGRREEGQQRRKFRAIAISLTQGVKQAEDQDPWIHNFIEGYLARNVH